LFSRHHLLTSILPMYLTFLRVAFDYCSLPFSKEGSQRRLAWQCMLTNTTYRLDKTADRQASIGFRVLYRTVKRIRSGQPAELSFGNRNSHVYYDANHNNADLKKAYILAHRGIEPNAFLSKETIVTYLNTPLLVLLYCAVSAPLAVACMLIKRNRTNRALHIAHLAEATALVVYLKKTPNCSLYDFAPYHIDSNWLFTLASPLTKEYVKLPSPGPLTTHHSTLLCDVLVVSSAYQEFELTRLKNIRYTKVEKWLVERALSYIHLYSSGDFEQPKKSTIGYYSHASWLRAQANHREIGFNILESEETLLSALAEFLNEHNEFTLTLFLHPRERKSERMEQTINYYTRFIPREHFEIADSTLPSALSFHRVDISVSALSTVLFERLFSGFKTLIWNYGMTTFPYEDSELINISVSDKAALTNRLLDASRETTDSFFENNGLHGYRYTAYPYFVNHEAYFISAGGTVNDAVIQSVQ